MADSGWIVGLMWLAVRWAPLWEYAEGRCLFYYGGHVIKVPVPFFGLVGVGLFLDGQGEFGGGLRDICRGGGGRGLGCFALCRCALWRWSRLLFRMGLCVVAGRRGLHVGVRGLVVV